MTNANVSTQLIANRVVKLIPSDSSKHFHGLPRIQSVKNLIITITIVTKNGIVWQKSAAKRYLTSYEKSAVYVPEAMLNSFPHDSDPSETSV